MKKRKTYEISVIDKTYSKIISDETKFYTSDTALELGFELKETEYDFKSAEIVLLNIDDRSLVTRPVAKVLDSFAYKLDDDITSHYGDWRGQLRFEQAGEIYVSSPVKFRIENDLGNERPPQLSDVQSWVSLKRYADKLTDDLKQAVLEVEGMEGTFNANELERQDKFETAEQSRQTTFETNESERDRTFESNETTRQAQELERERAEGTRQQAETQRASAETSRASAEEQRKTDHANRSAELAGKANKKQEEWITPTLLNGFTGNVRYRKTQFNQLEVIGYLAYESPLGRNSLSAFTFISEYIPSWISGVYKDMRFKFTLEQDSSVIGHARASISSFNNAFLITDGGGGTKWHINITIPIT